MPRSALPTSFILLATPGLSVSFPLQAFVLKRRTSQPGKTIYNIGNNLSEALDLCRKVF